jgi:hypothetical protein
MRVRLVIGGLSIGSVLVAQACGGTTDTGDGGFDGSPNDATIDVPIQQNDTGTSDVTVNPDTGPGNDAGPGNDGAVDAGPDTSTNISIWVCGTVTVADCSLCTGHTMPCAYCANADASTLAGACVEQGGGCGGTIPMGYNLCRCSNGDAGPCPEAFQVCLNAGGPPTNDVCDTCGAVTTTNGLTCENGGKCTLDAGCM